MSPIGRRAALGLPAVAAVAAVLTSCGKDDDVSDRATVPPHPSSGAPQGKIAYGADPQQWGELFLPSGLSKGVVVVVHGGFWLAEYDADTYGRPLAVSLAANGWTAWNLEYRRVGDGGGDPQTFDDVAAGIDKLADLDLDLTHVIAVGHSAGGHLATWAASRGRYPSWKPETVPLTHVVSQAGVLDLRSAFAENLGGGAVQGFLGHEPGPADNPLDPIRNVPLDIPVWCIHGDADQNVPVSQSQTYVDAAVAAGQTAELHIVAGDHFVLIDPDGQAWKDTLAQLDSWV